MAIPIFACYWRLYHSYAHSTTHTTTNNHSYQQIRGQPLPNTDVESVVEPGYTKKRQMDARTWLLLCFLLIDLVASIGCFSVFQSFKSNAGHVKLLALLESWALLMRLAIWAYCDDAPPSPLEIILKLDKYEHKPLPTCNKDNWGIFAGYHILEGTSRGTRSFIT